MSIAELLDKIFPFMLIPKLFNDYIAVSVDFLVETRIPVLPEFIPFAT